MQTTKKRRSLRQDFACCECNQKALYGNVDGKWRCGRHASDFDRARIAALPPRTDGRVSQDVREAA